VLVPLSLEAVLEAFEEACKEIGLQRDSDCINKVLARERQADRFLQWILRRVKG
jgi:hypothetical protein